MINTKPQNHSYAHGHVAVFYATPEERLQMLANYFREGLGHGELCVYASSQPVELVIDAFAAAGLYIAEALAHGRLQLLEMEATYLPHGTFVANYMLHNVASFIEDAERREYTGLRTAGDMIWIGDHPEFQSQAAGYEADVTDLGRQHRGFLGLCLYPLSDQVSVLQDALKTHPVFMYDGRLRVNPFVLDEGIGTPEKLTSRKDIHAFLATA